MSVDGTHLVMVRYIVKIKVKIGIQTQHVGCSFPNNGIESTVEEKIPIYINAFWVPA